MKKLIAVILIPCLLGDLARAAEHTSSSALPGAASPNFAMQAVSPLANFENPNRFQANFRGFRLRRAAVMREAFDSERRVVHETLLMVAGLDFFLAGQVDLSQSTPSHGSYTLLALGAAMASVPIIRRMYRGFMSLRSSSPRPPGPPRPRATLKNRAAGIYLLGGLIAAGPIAAIVATWAVFLAHFWQVVFIPTGFVLAATILGRKSSSYLARHSEFKWTANFFFFMSALAGLAFFMIGVAVKGWHGESPWYTAGIGLVLLGGIVLIVDIIRGQWFSPRAHLRKHINDNKGWHLLGPANSTPKEKLDALIEVFHVPVWLYVGERLGWTTAAFWTMDALYLSGLKIGENMPTQQILLEALWKKQNNPTRQKDSSNTEKFDQAVKAVMGAGFVSTGENVDFRDLQLRNLAPVFIGADDDDLGKITVPAIVEDIRNHPNERFDARFERARNRDKGVSLELADAMHRFQNTALRTVDGPRFNLEMERLLPRAPNAQRAMSLAFGRIRTISDVESKNSKIHSDVPQSHPRMIHEWNQENQAFVANDVAIGPTFLDPAVPPAVPGKHLALIANLLKEPGYHTAQPQAAFDYVDGLLSLKQAVDQTSLDPRFLVASKYAAKNGLHPRGWGALYAFTGFDYGEDDLNLAQIPATNTPPHTYIFLLLSDQKEADPIRTPLWAWEILVGMTHEYAAGLKEIDADRPSVVLDTKHRGLEMEVQQISWQRLLHEINGAITHFRSQGYADVDVEKAVMDMFEFLGTGTWIPSNLAKLLDLVRWKIGEEIEGNPDDLMVTSWYFRYQRGYTVSETGAAAEHFAQSHLQTGA